MKKSFTHHIYSQYLKCLGIFLFCLLSQQVFAAQSTVTVSCTDPHDTTTCSITGDGAASESLITFAADLIQTAEGSGFAEGCISNGNDVTCNLNQNPTKPPLTMTCTRGSGTLHCALDGADAALTSLFTIDCDSSSTLKTCSIVTDTKELTNKLAGSIKNPNLLALAGSLVTCLNRNTFTESGGIYTEGGFQAFAEGSGETAPSYTANPSSLQDTCNQFLFDLDNNPDAAIALLKSLQPINPSAATDLGVANLRLAVNTIQSRLSRVRSGVADTNSANNHQLLVNNEWHNSGTLFADSNNIANDASQTVSIDKNISEYGKLGFFINASFLNAKQTDDSIELKSKARSSVLTLGVDYRFTDNVIGGLAFNLSQATTNFDSNADINGSLDDNGYSILLYSSIYSGNWFFDTALTLGGENYEQTREPLSIANSFTANFHGDLLSAAATAGYDFTFSSFGITPFAQVTVGSMSIDGYTETASNTAGPGTALALDGQTKDIGTLNLGTHFRYTAATQNGVFIPTVSLTWVNDFKDDAQTISGRFVANTNPNSSFTLQTNALDTSYFIIATGFSFQLKGGNAGFVNIESVQGYSNLSQERITAGWRWEI